MDFAVTGGLIGQALPKLIGGVLELVGLWDCCAPLLGEEGGRRRI